MKKTVEFMHNGSCYTIECGKIYNDSEYRCFKITGDRLGGLFTAREMRISEAGNAYPVKGSAGIRYLTKDEVARYLRYYN